MSISETFGKENNHNLRLPRPMWKSEINLLVYHHREIIKSINIL